MRLPQTKPRLGASVEPDGTCVFNVWAPHARQVTLRIVNEHREQILTPSERGYYSTVLSDLQPDTRYLYRLDGKEERPDPASRWQPDGVFAPSQIIDLTTFPWSDHNWKGLRLDDYVLYELHVGTYTPAGTLDAVEEYLPDLKALGITAIELMPLAQFSGERNWGYDGVFPFAVQNSYGGPRALQRLVNACHANGLAVVLDVVYNHLGPEGNFLAEFGPYFTDRYRTPWGSAINFDGADSDEVVRYFVENALSWLEDFHIDALRLDAIHGIYDRNAQPFLALLSSAVDDLAEHSKRHVYLIAESDLNDSHFVTPRDRGGYGLHAQWNDDFHHALHSIQTGEHFGYYQDFGSLRHLETAMRQGYVYTGQYSNYRRRRQGNSSSSLRPQQLVVFSQNHDQVGNRMLGERSSTLLSFEAVKLSAAIVVLSAYIPLLFMGEEYGETAPFLYFTSHADPALGDAVRKGRLAEFSGFHWKGAMPDPQAESTYLQSKLNHHMRFNGQHSALWDFYRELIRLRKTLPAVDHAHVLQVICSEENRCLRVQRASKDDEVVMMFNFGEHRIDSSFELPAGRWKKDLDSADSQWMGPGSAIPMELASPPRTTLTFQPKSLCLFRRASSERVSRHDEPAATVSELNL